MNHFKKFLRIRISLTFKFILAMFFLVLVSSAAFGYFFIAREINLLKENLEGHGKSLANIFGLFINQPSDMENRAYLQRIVERVIQDEDVVHCILLAPSGEELASARKPVLISSPNDLIHVHQVSQPLRSKGGDQMGIIQIGLSLQKLEGRTYGMKRDILLVTMGIIGLGTLFTIILTRILLLPIEKLAMATEKVARGELAHWVDIRSRDEIGDLARAFNQMTLQLKESRQDLERKVEERTRQLEQYIDELNQAKAETLEMLEDLQNAKRELEMVNRELKEMDETKMKFIGIASHELKTPLTAIKANIDFILSEKEGRIPEHLKPYLLTIQRNTNRIQMRMDHMLDFSRIKSGRILLHREQVFLSEVIGGYITEVRPVEKNIAVEVDIPESLSVYADRNGLHDIFVNLLSNAFKFTSDGGQVKIKASRKDQFVLHEIQDTGMGIPEKEHKKIFEEFYQVESGKHGGTGLGLAITKRLVEEQGGKIWVVSQQGKGSIFYFTLPALMEEEDEKSSDA